MLAEAAVRGVRSAEPVNLAFGSRTSLLDLVAHLEELLGMAVRVERQPPRTGDVRDSQAADDRLRRLFPDLTPVPLTVGLARTVDWFRGLPQYADRVATTPAREPVGTP